MDVLASRMLLRPADLDRAVRYYRDGLGLAVARTYPGGVVFFAGQSLLELAGHGTPTTGGTLWLQVRDVDATAAELAARGVPIAREPRREPWGLHEMHLAAPDGVTLIVVHVPAGHPLRGDTRS